VSYIKEVSVDLGVIAVAIGLFLLVIGLSLFVAAILSPSITRFDIFARTNRFELSVSQLQRFYEWRISQYSSIGNTLLGAAAAFIASVVLEKLKTPYFNVGPACLIGVGATLFLCIICNLQVRALRNGFIEGYTIVERLSNVAAKITGNGAAAR
jgi:hypothetical protein